MVVKILVVLITTSVFAISANSETIVKEKKYNFESALYRSNSCSDDIEAKEYSWARISCAKEANENKHPMAFINTITLYAKGIGGEKDDVKALEFAKKGANHGHPHAMNILAHMYENGVGTNQSIEMALEWYLKAANGGFVDAYYNLGLLNEKIKNFIEAEKFYKIAYENGDTTAAIRRSLLYLNGQGVEKNLAAAYRFASVAIASGVVVGEEIVSMIEKELSPDKISLLKAAAKKEIESYKYR